MVAAARLSAAVLLVDGVGDAADREAGSDLTPLLRSP
jgi:hypothetical protein